MKLRKPDEGATTEQAGDLLTGEQVLVDMVNSAITGMVCCAKWHGDEVHVHVVNLPAPVFEWWFEVPHTRLVEVDR